MADVNASLLWPGALVAIASAALSASLIVLLRPLLLRYALARPNARSSHKLPTPQGGGVAVIAAALVTAAIALFLLPAGTAPVMQVAIGFAAAVAMALLGGIDDIRAIAVLPRLALQALAVAAVVAMLPPGFTILPYLPWWADRALLVLGGIWFLNLTNFMDGLDWMTVAQMLPLTAALAVLGYLDAMPLYGVVIALTLFGALAGFAPFNKPVARLFLGDVGSLPLGLLIGWLLLMLAERGHLVAALLLPLYYIADATITLLRRLARGERVWQAHRTHFYQRATDHGWSVMAIVLSVFTLNIALAGLAMLSVLTASSGVKLSCLVIGATLVGLLLTAFCRERR